MVNPGANAEFACFVNANPIAEDTIKWTRDGFDMETRTVSTNISNAVYLTVKNVSSEDSGIFDCVANNGIGEEVKNSTFLLVRGEESVWNLARFSDIRENVFSFHPIHKCASRAIVNATLYAHACITSRTKHAPAAASSIFIFWRNSKLHEVTKTSYFPAKPSFDDSPGIAKSASDKGQVGVLTCRAKGAPDIEFTWSRHGSVLDPEEEKYEFETKMVDR